MSRSRPCRAASRAWCRSPPMSCRCGCACPSVERLQFQRRAVPGCAAGGRHGAAASRSPARRTTASCWSCTCGASAAAASPSGCSGRRPAHRSRQARCCVSKARSASSVTVTGADPVLMVAGGTGFAPLKSMLRHVLENGIRRDIHLYWGARHTRDLYEEAQVLEWVRRHPQLASPRCSRRPAASEAAHHRVGWVHEAVLADYPHACRLRGVRGRTAGDDRGASARASRATACRPSGCTSIPSITRRMRCRARERAARAAAA